MHVYYNDDLAHKIFYFDRITSNNNHKYVDGLQFGNNKKFINGNINIIKNRRDQIET
jgi:hypothetical protein